MSRWSDNRAAEWKAFCRSLARMGRLLDRQKAPEGGYAPKQSQRHPLLEIVFGAPRVVAAIGTMIESDQEQSGVLSWANVNQGDGAATVRLYHKGTKARCAEALDAAIDALRRAGRRVSFRDMIRHENQNSYICLMRVADAPSLAMTLGGFAR